MRQPIRMADSRFFIFLIAILTISYTASFAQAELPIPESGKSSFQRLLRTPHSVGLMDRFCKSIAQSLSSKEWANSFQTISDRNGPANIVAGHWRFRRCEFDLALSHYLKAKQEIPSDTKLELALARTYRNLGKYDRVIESFDAAISATNDLQKKSEIYSELITLLAWEEQFNSIRILIEQAYDDFVSAPHSLEKITSTLELFGLHELAIELIQKSISQSKNLEKKFTSRFKLAKFYAQSGRQNDSLSLYGKLLNEADHEHRFSIDVLKGLEKLFKSNGERFKLFQYLIGKFEAIPANKKPTRFDRYLFRLTVDSAIEVYEFEKAITVINFAIENESIAEKKIDWIELRVAIELRLNDVKALEISFEQLSKLRAETPEDLFKKLDWLKQLNQPNRLGSSIHKSLLAAAKKDPSIYVSLGTRLFEDKEYSKAIELTSKAVKADPENHEWFYRLGLYQLNSKQIENALNSWDQLLLKKEVSASLHLQIIAELLRSGFAEKAYEYNKSLVDEDSTYSSFELQASHAKQLIDRKNFSASDSLIQRMLLDASSVSKRNRIFELEVMNLKAQGVLQAKISELLQDEDSSYSLIQQQRLLCYLISTGDLSKAISIQKQILGRNSKSDAEIEKLANLYVDNKQYEKAISVYQNRLLNSQSNTFSTLEKINRLQMLAGNAPATEESFKKILSISPANTNALINLAEHQIQHFKSDKGMQLIESLLIESSAKKSKQEQILNRVLKSNSKKLVQKTLNQNLKSASDISQKIELARQIVKLNSSETYVQELLNRVNTWKANSQWPRSSVEVAAEIYTAISQPQKAIQQLETLGEKDFFLNLKLSRLAEEAKQYEKAIQYLNQSINQIPQGLASSAIAEDHANQISSARLSNLHFQVAIKHDEENEPQLATNHYEKAIEYHPQNVFKISKHFENHQKAFLAKTISELDFSKAQESPLEIISLMSKARSENPTTYDMKSIRKYWKAFPEYRDQLIQRNPELSWDQFPSFFKEIYFSFSQEKKEPESFSLLKITIELKEGKLSERIGFVTKFLDHVQKQDGLQKLIDDIGPPNSEELKVVLHLAQHRLNPSNNSILPKVIEVAKKNNLPEKVLFVIGTEISRSSSEGAIRFYENFVAGNLKYDSLITKDLLRRYAASQRNSDARKLLFRLRLSPAIDFSDRIDRATYLLDTKFQIANDLIPFNGAFEAFWVASFMKEYVDDLGDEYLKDVWTQRINDLLESSKKNLISTGSSEG